MYLIYAPPKKFSILPPGAAPLTPHVTFFQNVAYCDKFYFYKMHMLASFVDLSPHWMRRARKKRTLRTVLFILGGAYGDSMWIMPVIRQFRSLYPSTKITVCAPPRTLNLYQNFPYADNFIPDSPHLLQGAISSHEEVYDFGGIATFLVKEMRMDPVDAAFHHIQLPPPRDPALMLPHLVITLDEAQRAKTLLEKYSIHPTTEKIICICCETSTSNRNWPISYLIDLSKLLLSEGYKVIVLGLDTNIRDITSLTCSCGWNFTISTKNIPESLSVCCPSCHAYTLLDRFGCPPGIHDFTSLTDYRTTLAILSLSDAFVGPASSLIVASTALSIPTVGIFGSFSPRSRCKYYRKFFFVWGKPDCAPCNDHWTECPHGSPAPCMKLATPQQVFIQIQALLMAYPRPSITKNPFE